MKNWTRKEFLKASLVGGAAASTGLAASARTKKVIVIGGGIGGLCCAYEVMDRGHDVTVLEASRRTGGHVKTIRAPLPDGLYADVGAEHFTQDTIEQCIVHPWWKEEPTCFGCERQAFPLGQLAKVWPHLIEPVGRIHFAGAGYDNMTWGQDAATRSANRVARVIHDA